MIPSVPDEYGFLNRTILHGFAVSTVFTPGIFQDDEKMNYRDASIRGIGDFACGDQLTQLDRGRTESPARSIFAMQSIAV